MFFERFTDRARRTMVLAQEQSRLLGQNFVGTEHILLGLLAEGEATGALALTAVGVSLDEVHAAVTARIEGDPTASTGSPPFTPQAKKVLDLALREALQLGHNYIGTEHILLGMIREGEGVAAQVLEGLGVDLFMLRHVVIDLLSGYAGTTEPPVDTAAPGARESTAKMRRAVARDTCRGEGHDFGTKIDGGSLAPVQMYCQRCRSTWRIHPDDVTQSWGTPTERTAD